MQFERRRGGAVYVAEAYADDQKVLLPLIERWPTGFVQWEMMGIPWRNDDGTLRSTGPTYVFWRPKPVTTPPADSISTPTSSAPSVSSSYPERQQRHNDRSQSSQSERGFPRRGGRPGTAPTNKAPFAGKGTYQRDTRDSGDRRGQAGQSQRRDDNRRDEGRRKDRGQGTQSRRPMPPERFDAGSAGNRGRTDSPDPAGYERRGPGAGRERDARRPAASTPAREERRPPVAREEPRSPVTEERRPPVTREEPRSPVTEERRPPVAREEPRPPVTEERRPPVAREEPRPPVTEERRPPVAREEPRPPVTEESEIGDLAEVSTPDVEARSPRVPRRPKRPNRPQVRPTPDASDDAVVTSGSADSALPTEPAALVEAPLPPAIRAPEPEPEDLDDSSLDNPARGMRGPRTTKHKNITRLDREDKDMYGYLVRLMWRGETRQKFFSDRAYDDAQAALDAAIIWRDDMERELGKPRSEGLVVGRASSNTGIVGVTRTTKRGDPVFQVTWYEDGRQRRRVFNIRLLGENRALRAAIKARAAAEEQRVGSSDVSGDA